MFCDHSGLVMDDRPFQGILLRPVQKRDWDQKIMLLFMLAVWLTVCCIRAGYASRRPSCGSTFRRHAWRRHCGARMARLSNDLFSVTQIFHDCHRLLPHLALHSRTQADASWKGLFPSCSRTCALDHLTAQPRLRCPFCTFHVQTGENFRLVLHSNKFAGTVAGKPQKPAPGGAKKVNKPVPVAPAALKPAAAPTAGARSPAEIRQNAANKYKEVLEEVVKDAKSKNDAANADLGDPAVLAEQIETEAHTAYGVS